MIFDLEIVNMIFKKHVFYVQLSNNIFFSLWKPFITTNKKRYLRALKKEGGVSIQDNKWIMLYA